MSNGDQILIVGGGAVGLISALALALADVPVTVFERFGSLQDDPRAATTHPATLELLAQLDIEEEVRQRGLVCPIFQFWDRPSGELVAEFDHNLLSDETDFPYVVQCEQFKTTQIALAKLQQLDNANVYFSHEVTAIKQAEDETKVWVRGPDGQMQVHTGQYVIGADGGRSTVRKAAGIPFEGFTWSELFLVLTTPFDFARHKGYSERNYFADPEEWCNCFKVAADGPPGLWRTVFPANSNADESELLSDQAVQAKLKKFFPREQDYEVVHRNLYRVHQRVANTFRKGRVLLAGDAAHVNNPIGGMGLNGGIQDACNVSEKLIDIWHGRGDEKLLDLYDLQRRTITTEFVQAQTIQNKKRLEEKDPSLRQTYLEELKATASDPELAKDFLLRTSMLSAQRRAASLGLHQ